MYYFDSHPLETGSRINRRNSKQKKFAAEEIRSRRDLQQKKFADHLLLAVCGGFSTVPLESCHSVMLKFSTTNTVSKCMRMHKYG